MPVRTTPGGSLAISGISLEYSIIRFPSQLVDYMARICFSRSPGKRPTPLSLNAYLHISTVTNPFPSRSNSLNAANNYSTVLQFFGWFGSKNSGYCLDSSSIPISSVASATGFRSIERPSALLSPAPRFLPFFFRFFFFLPPITV